MEDLNKDGTKSNGKYDFYCDYPYDTPAGYQYYDYSPPTTVPFKLDLEPQRSHSYYRPRDVDLRSKGMKAELSIGAMHGGRGSGDVDGLRDFDNGGGRRDVNDGFGMQSRGPASRGERLNRETCGQRTHSVPGEGLERREIMEHTETDTGQKRICSMFVLILVLIVVIFVIVAALVLYFNYSADEVQARGSEGDYDLCQGIFCPYGDCYLGQCQCPKDCPSNRAVCGSDGTTYASECHLQRRACTTGANTSFVHVGSCQISTEPCEDLQCRPGEVCIVTSTGEPKCQCRPNCPQDDDQGPVCGSDGSDYQSQCELSRAACAVKKHIEVRYAGMCDPCGHVVCAKGQICMVDDARVPRCQCNSSCSTTLSPVCASDGRTYSNECVMNFEACSRRQILAVMYRGECSSGVNPCGAVRCGTGQGCVVNQYGVATCQCRQWCPPVLRPICGTDGNTYDSKCHLNRESCLSQSSVKIAFVGSCGSQGPCEGYKCDNGGICVEKYGQAECECPECGGEYEPVCGGDRRTYHSRCLLERSNCLSRDHVQLLHDGPCDACKGIDCGEFGMCEVDSEGFGRCSCQTNCSQALGGQVCGSDGETYASECHLHMKACSSQNQIKVSHKGNCDLCLDVHCKYGARCEGGRCICPTDCPEKREPVCGSDRVTYSNECVMRKVACEKNEDLSYVFFGECDELGGIVTDVIYPTPLPPTNPEDPCHTHKCIAGAKCESENGHSRCVCDFYCSPPPRYEPVCGSDMEFYESECLMRLHACNIQVELFVVPVEDCAVAQRSRACNGTSPLINPSTGEDLFCGEGGTICPPGTYCHKNHDFAKCCRDNSVRIAVIEAPVPDDCEQSEFGCCADGINFARGPESEGCPEGCRCHRLGALSESCEAVSGRCECRPGVGGNNCDRCLPGYYGLHRISEGSIGCTPCGCSRFGSLRSDCKQMTGECVCKPGVSGHRCTECPQGKVLRPEGCVYDDSLVPQATTCDLLHCHFGGICQEESGIASCTCINHCLPLRMSGGLAVCGSNRMTYSSECDLNHQACVQQADIVVVAFGSCSESWTDAPVRRSTAEDGWGTAEWAWVGRGHTEHHALATRRHLDTAHFTRAHPIHLVHFINTIIESPPTGVTPITPLDSEEENLVSPKRPAWLYNVPAFAGHSYLQMMPWSVPSKVQLEIEFSTHQLDGVLLYVQQSDEGEGDFLALVLDKGYLELRIDLGNGPVVIRSTTQISPFVKNVVSIRTYNRDALLQIGVGESISGRSSGMHRALDIHAPLYVGGVPSFTSKIMENIGVNKGLTGCVYSLKVGQRDLDLIWGRSGSVSHGYNITDCRPSPCAGRPCLNGGTCHASHHTTSYACSCPKSHTGVRCDISVNEGCRKLRCPPKTSCQTLLASSTLHCVPDSPLDTYELEEEAWPIADLSGDGYLSLPRSEGVSEGLTLELWFLARASHGMLLYGGQGPTHKGDFISLNLVAGHVQFRFDVGPGVVNLTSRREISEGEWHRVVATWEGGRASLQLDKDTPVTSEAPGPPNTLTLNTPLYLGGFKLWYMVNRDSGILVGLDGALQRLLVNGVVYDRLLEAATDQRGVSRYSGPPCLPNPCFNAAICVPLLNDFYCKCSFMFVGRLCDQALMSIDLDQPIHFDGSTSVLYPGQFLLSFNKSEMFVPWSHPDYDYLNYDEVEHQLLDQVAEDNDLDFKKESRVQGRTHDIIEISFRAEDDNGLLVWVSHGKGSGRGRADYLALALVGGLPQLALNLGRSRKPFVLTSMTGVNDGSWHVVRVTRRWRRVLLKVDNHRPVRGRAPRGPSTLHTDGNLWIGGQRSLPPHLGPAFHSGFRGCVDRLLVDSRELHLVHHAASRHIQFCHTFT